MFFLHRILVCALMCISASTAYCAQQASPRVLARMAQEPNRVAILQTALTAMTPERIRTMPYDLQVIIARDALACIRAQEGLRLAQLARMELLARYNLPLFL